MEERERIKGRRENRSKLGSKQESNKREKKGSNKKEGRNKERKERRKITTVNLKISRIQLFTTSWTIESMEFSRPE